MMIWVKIKIPAMICLCLGTVLAVTAGLPGVKLSLGVAVQKVTSSKASAFKYVINDFKVYPIPKISKPAKGKTIRDPTFHTKIVRITDRHHDKLIAWGKTVKIVINDYARIDPENCDGTKALFKSTRDGGRWFVYDLKTCKMLIDIRKEAKDKKIVVGEIEPRWDRYNPNLFYFRHHSTFYKYDISTKKIVMIRDFKKDFPEDIVRIRTRYEGRPSFDSRYWAFRAESRNWRALEWVWYDLQKNEIVASLKGPPGSDHVTMAIMGDFFCAGAMGHVAYNLRDLPAGKVSTKLSPTTTHSDLAITAEGREVMVYQNGQNDWIEMTYLDTGQTIQLIKHTHKTNWKEMSKGGSGMHFSGISIATPGWVLVSWYGGAPYEAYAWQHQSLFMLELKKNPRVWRIAHTHCPWSSVKKKDYWAEAFAAINAAGTRVYWGSNWDVPGKDRTIDVYCVNLPETWYSDLMGQGNARKARTATRKRIKEKLGKKAAEGYDKLVAHSAK